MKRSTVIFFSLIIITVIGAFPELTGIPLHEILSLFVVLILIVHMALRGDTKTIFWSSHSKRKIKKSDWILDWFIFGLLIVSVASGVMGSQFVIIKLGLYPENMYYWMPIHAISSKILIGLILIHLVSHIQFLKISSSAGVQEKGRNDE